ncbi:MAG: hypothetical protein V3T72_19195, partial [Thermoanaerobaculia bacterium]
YLKDDGEYQDYLIDRIRKHWRLELSNGNGGDGKSLDGAALSNFLERVESFRDNMNRLVARGFPADALRIALVHGLHSHEDLRDADRVEKVAHVVEGSGFHEVRMENDEEHGTRAIAFRSRRDGVDREVRMDWNLMTSAEYRAMARNHHGLEALGCELFTLSDGEESHEFQDLDEVLERLYSGAKKGVTIQRYKGLGEMNADQLWETTMDPAERHLLQVRVEDVGAADEVFTILMGDQVEPRRRFIIENALEVKNLDV